MLHDADGVQAGHVCAGQSENMTLHRNKLRSSSRHRDVKVFGGSQVTLSRPVAESQGEHDHAKQKHIRAFQRVWQAPGPVDNLGTVFVIAAPVVSHLRVHATLSGSDVYVWIFIACEASRIPPQPDPPRPGPPPGGRFPPRPSPTSPPAAPPRLVAPLLICTFSCSPAYVSQAHACCCVLCLFRHASLKYPDIT